MDAWREEAERALSGLWGAPVACTISQVFREQGRNRVLRLAVAGGPVESVILKACAEEDGSPYRAGDVASDSAFRRLCNESAGAAVLGPLGLGASPYLIDTERGFCLLEDLGDGETLADKLLADDPAAATAALFAYARSLGEMHAATAGQAARWAGLLAERGMTGGEEQPPVLAPILDFCRGLGVEPEAGLEGELSAIVEALAAPGPGLAFTPSDCCPDNHYVRGERVAFFDCEFARVRHAALDASYFLAPFPTCWCCAALPDGLPQELLAAYREAAGPGPDFDDQLTRALAAWFGRTARMPFDVRAADRVWGLSTARQRVRRLIQQLIARPNLGRLAPSLGRTLNALDQRLAAEWSDTPAMPLYPAFR